MRSNRLWILLLLVVFVAGCGGGGGGAPAPPATLTSITITPANPSLTLGSQQQFTANGIFSDGSSRNLSGTVVWSSSNPAVASITTTGVATALVAGATTISAASSGIVGTTTLNVALASIAVPPLPGNLVVGEPLQLTATGTYADNSTQTITGAVTWTSNNPSVVFVSNNPGSVGRATVLGTGSATIAANSDGIVSPVQTVTVSGSTPANVMPVTVNGSLCDPVTSASYPNKPCVRVKVCEPNNANNCVVIDDVLLDTMSFGLRVFKSALVLPNGSNMALTQVSSGTGSLAECVQFADLTSIWGPVQLASVQLASEPPVQVPIQVIDANFFANNIPTAVCRNADATPAIAGYHAILGIGALPQDCGAGCSENQTNNGFYFSCTTSSCTGAAVNTTEQVQNPVAKLPRDNNGLVVEFPAVPLGGVATVNGVMVLGIDSQTNNVPVAVTTFETDQFSELVTAFNNQTYTGFLDTGSNGFFFANSTQTGLSPCSSDPSWYCPSAPVTITATNIGGSGTSQPVSFQIGNFSSLVSSGNKVFVEIGGPAPGTFDYGLPFFFGRNIYIGISGRSSSLGTGPYFAY